VLPSHLSTTTFWSTNAKGLLISDYWLEAGELPHPDVTNGIHPYYPQIWAALKQYKQLPHTFIYLFSFFLLADV